MLYAISPETVMDSTDVPVNNNTILNGIADEDDGLTATEALTVDGINLIYIAYTSGSNHYINKVSIISMFYFIHHSTVPLDRYTPTHRRIQYGQCSERYNME